MTDDTQADATDAPVSKKEMTDALRALSATVEAKALAHRQAYDIMLQMLNQLTGQELNDGLCDALTQVKDAALMNVQVGEIFRNQVVDELDNFILTVKKG